MAVVLPDRSIPQQTRRGGISNFFRKLFRFILLIVALWAATWVIGFFTIRSDIIATKTRVAERFPTAKAIIRAPFPFVISYRVEGRAAKAGVTASYSTTAFYWWFGVAREIPEGQVLPIMQWIWF